MTDKIPHWVRLLEAEVREPDPVDKWRGDVVLLFVAVCFTLPLAIYGAIHAGRAVMVWLLGVM